MSEYEKTDPPQPEIRTVILDAATARNGHAATEPAIPSNPDLAVALELLSEAALKVAAILGSTSPIPPARTARRARPPRPPARKLYEHDLNDDDLCRVRYWANLPGNAWAGKFHGVGCSLALARRLLSAYRFCGVSAGAGNWPDDRLYRVGDIRAMAARDLDTEHAKVTSQWFALERAAGLRSAARTGQFAVIHNGRRGQLSFESNA